MAVLLRPREGIKAQDIPLLPPSFLINSQSQYPITSKPESCWIPRLKKSHLIHTHHPLLKVLRLFERYIRNLQRVTLDSHPSFTTQGYTIPLNVKIRKLKQNQATLTRPPALFYSHHQYQPFTSPYPTSSRMTPASLSPPMRVRVVWWKFSCCQCNVLFVRRNKLDGCPDCLHERCGSCKYQWSLE